MAWTKKGAYTKLTATWTRGKAVAHTWHLDSNPFGLRVDLMEWEDHPHEARLIKGDGRTANFKVLAEGVVPDKLNTYTAFCQDSGGKGTVWIEAVKAEDLDAAIELARETCAEAWERENCDDIHVLGIVEGNANVLMWDDLSD